MPTLLLGYKYRIYPTKDQSVLMDKHFGCCRMVYNLGLEVKQMAYAGAKVSLKYTDLSAQLTELKKEYVWLNEVNSQSLQSQLRNLDSAFTKFFKGDSSFPVFKKKFGRQSFHCPQGVFLKNGVLYLPKFREGVKIKLHRNFNGVVKTVTVSKTPTGKYFASVSVECQEPAVQKRPVLETSSIGIDLGLKTFIVTSEAKEYAHPKHLGSSLRKLKALQRRLSKKVKGSKNRAKAKKRVALLHEKIANQRKDFLHKVSTEITNQYDTVCVETLRVKNMMSNHCLARSIADSGWGVFIGFIEYKCRRRGANLLRIGTFSPSSKTCSNCGAIKKDLTLSDRNWICEKCLSHHDRDVNAAKNIKAFALQYSGQGLPGEPVELPTMVGARKQELYRQ